MRDRKSPGLQTQLIKEGLWQALPAEEEVLSASWGGVSGECKLGCVTRIRSTWSLVRSVHPKAAFLPAL